MFSDVCINVCFDTFVSTYIYITGDYNFMLLRVEEESNKRHTRSHCYIHLLTFSGIANLLLVYNETFACSQGFSAFR